MRWVVSVTVKFSLRLEKGVEEEISRRVRSSMEDREISCTSPSEVSSDRRPDGVRDWCGRLDSGLALVAIVSLVL